VKGKNRNTTLRKAQISDIPIIHELVNAFASQGEMLGRSRSELYEGLRDFYVADSGWRTAAIDLNDPPAKFPLVKTKLADLDNRDNDGDGTVDETGEKYPPLNDSDLMRNTVFDYTAQGPWGDPERAVGSSGAMNCANVIFKVDSKSQTYDEKDGTWNDSQNISARLVKLCCAGY